jgi:hypothetical protein
VRSLCARVAVLPLLAEEPVGEARLDQLLGDAVTAS